MREVCLGNLSFLQSHESTEYIWVSGK
ncbi:hypothetical protein CUMW_243010 [Citrus unshiu]|uniref:Uncharacterized protein n=1 Tax=Citrus unshiu TaxID=55188 RepID=A0A2H5QM40_CITUN|nr:hypothetical protein CUMW_243010 [Citrus unshiu]